MTELPPALSHATDSYYGQQPANAMAQALTLFDSRHLLIVTSFDSWCGQMNEDLGLQVILTTHPHPHAAAACPSSSARFTPPRTQLARHGAPNMSSYIPGGNCTDGSVFLLVAGKRWAQQPLACVDL